MGGRLTICEVPGLLCGSQDKLKALAGTYPPESTPSQVMCVPHRQVCMWSVCVCVCTCTQARLPVGALSPSPGGSGQSSLPSCEIPGCLLSGNGFFTRESPRSSFLAKEESAPQDVAILQRLAFLLRLASASWLRARVAVQGHPQSPCTGWGAWASGISLTLRCAVSGSWHFLEVQEFFHVGTLEGPSLFPPQDEPSRGRRGRPLGSKVTTEHGAPGGQKDRASDSSEPMRGGRGAGILCLLGLLRAASERQTPARGYFPK